MLPLRDNVPRRRKPIITGAIIAANILVFIWQSTMNPFELRTFIFEFGLIPSFFY